MYCAKVDMIDKINFSQCSFWHHFILMTFIAQLLTSPNVNH